MKAFESVVPSERTKLSVKITDGSLRAFAPSHLGALVVHLADFSFSTDLVGGAEELALVVNIHALNIMFTDNSSLSEDQVKSSTSQDTLSYWKVRPLVSQVRLTTEGL